MPTPATDVFLSYKAEDRARIKVLAAALEAEGFSVWWDGRIGGGANWQHDIEQHLDAAKCVLVAWTRRSTGEGGHFVRDEARRAQRRGAYLPVCLDAVDPPLGFGEIQALSLKGWNGRRSDLRFRSVAAAVRVRIDGLQSDSTSGDLRQSGVSRRAVVAGGAGVLAVAAGGGAWLFLKPPAANSHRIAVLPFANLSGDPQQAYFADGIAEELRSGLSRIGLEVIGRASSEAVKNLDTKAAAAKLSVANILTGSVRRSPQMIRINAQLVSGSDGVERWGQSYDRAPGDAIKIQSDIAANVVHALSVALGSAGRLALELGGTADTIAQDLLLQSRAAARASLTVSALRKSLQLAEAAIARDPNYADAYVAKAQALITLAQYFSPQPENLAQVAEAEAAAKRASSIAPRLGSPFVQLGLVENSRLNFRTMLAYLKQAVNLSPEDPTVLAESGRNLTFLGLWREGFQLVNRSVELDPLNVRSYGSKAMTLYFGRRYSEAVEAVREALAVGPDVSAVHAFSGFSLLQLRRVPEAVAEFRAMPDGDPFRLTGEALAAAQLGDISGAERTMGRMKRALGAAASYQYAEINARLGKANDAFANLEAAIVAKDPGLSTLKVDPLFDDLRRDPRYGVLLGRLDFP